MLRRWLPKTKHRVAAVSLLALFAPGQLVEGTPPTYGPGGYYYPGWSNRPTVAVNYSVPVGGRQAITQIQQAPQPASATASIEVRVPPQAAIWFNGVRMYQAGAERRFVTPMLQGGIQHSYELIIRWREGGREVTVNQPISIRAGERLSYDIPNSATASVVRSSVIESPMVQSMRPSSAPHMSLVEFPTAGPATAVLRTQAPGLEATTSPQLSPVAQRPTPSIESPVVPQQVGSTIQRPPTSVEPPLAPAQVGVSTQRPMPGIFMTPTQPAGTGIPMSITEIPVRR